MEEDPQNIVRAKEYAERASRCLMEENRSSIKNTWIAIQNAKDLQNSIEKQKKNGKEILVGSNKFSII
jgi:hypothetical protein